MHRTPLRQELLPMTWWTFSALKIDYELLTSRKILWKMHRDMSIWNKNGTVLGKYLLIYWCCDVTYMHIFFLSWKLWPSAKNLQYLQKQCYCIYIFSSGEIKSKAKSKDETTQLKVEVLRMLSDELIESERWIFSALHLLKETVRSSAANSLDRVSVLSNLVNTLHQFYNVWRYILLWSLYVAFFKQFIMFSRC